MALDEFVDIASNPVFFERNRVFRVYKGGKLFKDFFGDADEDGNYPEEWVASSVKALNKDSVSQYEGISGIQGKEVYFDWLLANYSELMLGERKNFDVLVKLLDSAIRLPVQAHPDRNFSMKYFSSSYGKTEMWLVLATRENAKIYFGFKDGVNKEDFISAIEKSQSDKDIMASFLNELPAKTGDVYLIPARIAHAIGYGCLILEVQEPTDFTIQPEAWCGDYHLNEYEMYLGLQKEQALECFNFSVTGGDAVRLGRKQPVVLEQSKTLCAEKLIGYEDTKCFSVNRYKLAGGSLTLKNAPSVYIVVEGAGVVKSPSCTRKVKKGDYFFLPYAAGGKCSIEAKTGIELVECLPSLEGARHLSY